jgi:hypothetical protein
MAPGFVPHFVWSKIFCRHLLARPRWGMAREVSGGDVKSKGLCFQVPLLLPGLILHFGVRYSANRPTDGSRQTAERSGWLAKRRCGKR